MTRPVRLPRRFELVRELGRGGMGAVYEALDTERGARVAIKTLPSHDPVAIARFKREFRSLSDLHHPNLVSLGELFCEEGEWAFSMDLIEGTDIIDHVRPARRDSLSDAVSDAPTASLPFAPAPADAPVAAAGESAPPAPFAAFADLIDDDRKLRDAFIQLVQGVAALHAVEKIHRDIKPSNIRVRPDGQVILLDFGLVTDGGEELSGAHVGLGTPLYMAPEQAMGSHVSTAADWYSVGVVLFEALTNRRPFEGQPLELMMAKQRSRAPRVRAIVPDAPEDLDELCARLLEPHPLKRPAAEAIVSALRRSTAPVPQPRKEDTRGTIAPTFVGRDEQLDRLAREFKKVLGGEPAQVVLEGESGAGKSYLARRFLDSVMAEHPKTMIVAGRCYENEAVPYNAWDGAIESLSTQWARLGREEAAMLLPLHIVPLLQTFPALRRVPVVARQAIAKLTLDPHELRSRAFTALRELLQRATRLGPIVVFLDDLQWADHDSVSLLGEVLREPSAPPFLFIAAARPLKDYPDLERRLRDALPRVAERCSVPLLPHTQAVALAAQLLTRDAPDFVGEAEAIAKEADGHALFITELVRHVAASGRADRGGLSLAEALWSRVSELPAETQRVLTVLALAARPLPDIVALQAAEAAPSDGPRVLSALRAGHFSRATRIDGVDWLETYHDRVRTAVFDKTAPEARVSTFKRIAAALEGGRFADPNALTDFWRLSGDQERAGRHARTAGDLACRALAFDRGAELYKVALETPSLTKEEHHGLSVLLGDTLAKAGRGKEAAETYLAAKAGAKSQAEINDLEQRACDEYLRHGHYDEGIAIGKRLLERVGVKWPASPVYAVLLIATLTFMLWLRGNRFRVRREEEVRPEDALRLDVLRNLGHWLMIRDPVRTVAFNLSQFRSALRVGDVGRVSIGFSANLVREAATRGNGTRRADARTDREVASVEALAAEVGGNYSRAFCNLTVGTTLLLSYRPGEALPRLGAAETAFREELHGKSFEVAWAQVYAAIACFYLGRFGSLVPLQSRALQEALDRSNLFGATNLRIGFAHFAWLVRDDVERATRAIEDVQVELAKYPFSGEHFWWLFATVNSFVYAGDARRALAAVERSWPAVRRSQVRLLSPNVRFETSEARARVHLAAAVAANGDRAAQLALAKMWGRNAARVPVRFAAPVCSLLRAEVAHVEGRREKAVALLREAVPALASVELHGYVAVAKRALGKLVKGDEGGALVCEGEEFLRTETVKNIPALCRCLAPGFSDVE